MEERITTKTQRILINNRKSGTISGVNDVVAFDTERIVLDTVGGLLTIKGQKLHVKRLSVEKGEVDIEGIVDGFFYKEQNRTDKDQSLMKKLFKWLNTKLDF